MTPEQMLEQSELMARYARSVIAGKPIEVEASGDGVHWNPTSGIPKWNFGSCLYREAPPKPDECWIVTHNGRTKYVYEDKAAAYKFGQGLIGATTIKHMREVV